MAVGGWWQPQALELMGAPLFPAQPCTEPHRSSRDERSTRQRSRSRCAPRTQGPPSRGSDPCGVWESCDELAERLSGLLKGSGDDRAAAIANLDGMVRKLSLDAGGCRVVQEALDVASQSGRESIVRELKGSVVPLCKSQHGNYVVQKAVEVMPSTQIGFVAEELCRNAVEIARHRFACRIVCRLLEHSARDSRTAALVDAIVAEGQSLCCNPYASHVLEMVLEHGLPEQRRSVVAALSQGLLEKARHRHGNVVVERALTFGSDEERCALAKGLLAGSPAEVVEIATSRFGRYPTLAALRLGGTLAERARRCLRAAEEEVRACHNGEELIEKLELSADSAAAVAAAAAP